LKTQLKDHPKPVTALAVGGDAIAAAGLDGNLSIFRRNAPDDWTRGYVKTTSLKLFRKEVTNMVFHPNGNFILAASRDRSWAIVDVNNGEVVCHAKDEISEITACDYHPGGGMIALGRADGSLEIKSVNGPNGTSIKVPTDVDGGAVRSVSFSFNCTGIVSAQANGAVCIWNLKGDPKVIQKIVISAGSSNTNKVTKVSFDRKSGKWLLICSQALNVYYQGTKDGEFSLVHTITDHLQAVTDAGFGNDCKVLASVSMDRDLRIYQCREK